MLFCPPESFFHGLMKTAYSFLVHMEFLCSSLERLQHTSRFGLSSATSLKITKRLPASGRVLSIQFDFSQLASDNYICYQKKIKIKTLFLPFFLSADIILLWYCKFWHSVWRILSKMWFSVYIKKTKRLDFFSLLISPAV